jgi:Lar family restriction alleviation protein
MTDDVKQEREAVLLPCPFCGSTNIDAEGWASTNSSGPACDDCGASAGSTLADTPEANIAAWNKRQPQTDALKVARDAAIEECALLVEGMGTSHDSHAGERFAKAIHALKESK